MPHGNLTDTEADALQTAGELALNAIAYIRDLLDDDEQTIIRGTD